MTDKRLFIFLEGPDDERFFGRIVVPALVHRYRSVEIILYAGMKRVRVSRFLKAVSGMGHEYFLVGDIDSEPNAKAKKRYLTERFENLDPGRIIVVIQEIEGWYLAGLDSRAEHELGLHPHRHTDLVTKEMFNNWIPAEYPSRIAFMSAILERFDASIARQKNRSFRFFSDYLSLFPDDEIVTSRDIHEKGPPGGEPGKAA